MRICHKTALKKQKILILRMERNFVNVFKNPTLNVTEMLYLISNGIGLCNKESVQIDVKVVP